MLGDTVTIDTPRCPICNEPSTLEVRKSGFDAWQAGQHIQHALSDLSADERELLLTGTHSACWDKMWPEEDEEDDDDDEV